MQPQLGIWKRFIRSLLRVDRCSLSWASGRPHNSLIFYSDIYTLVIKLLFQLYLAVREIVNQHKLVLSKHIIILSIIHTLRIIKIQSMCKKYGSHVLKCANSSRYDTIMSSRVT